MSGLIPIFMKPAIADPIQFCAVMGVAEGAVAPTGVPCFDLPGLPEAVRRASGLAKSGDVVLLSPACASLDMFTNYAHRAQVFVDAVRDIALEKGQEI